MEPSDEDGIEFAPGVLEDIKELAARDPKAAEAFRIMMANMRNAHQAWRSGRYPSFEDAVEAITGNRPVKVDE